MSGTGRPAKTVSLVLGSGGARGHAHIGVIRALEERELEIRNIAGTSIGAVIGGVYSAGKLDTYTQWAESLTRSDIVRLLDLSLSRKALFKGERIFRVLQELIGNRDIEHLDHGFTAVATDIDAQREVWLNRGALFRAVRASAAVPGIFDPVDIDGRTLVDGGIVNPVPIAPTLNDRTDLTIAVNLNSISATYEPPEHALEEGDGNGGNSFGERVAAFVSDLVDTDDDEDPAPGAAELLTQSIDVMQGAIARLKLAAYAPDEVIEIPRNACSFFEFDRAREMAELGYTQTTGVLDELGL